MQEHASNEANPLDPGETLPQDLQRGRQVLRKTHHQGTQKGARSPPPCDEEGRRAPGSGA